jgi:hypothetical protein
MRLFVLETGMGHAQIIFLRNIIWMAEKYLKNSVYQNFE